MADHRWNWAANYEYRAQAVHEPESLEELQELVAKTPRIRALGTRHSFNDLADTNGDHVSLAKLPRRTWHSSESFPIVSFEGGMRYGDLCLELAKQGDAIHNLASLPHISIAGAVATGTHGSGDKNGNLSTAVYAMTVVNQSGEIEIIDPLDPDFHGTVVSLGALGIVVGLSLKVTSAFDVSQVVYENLPFDQLDSHFDEITSSAYSVSLFTHWNGPAVEQMWQKHVGTTEFPDYFFGATRATQKLHPIKTMPALNCTEQMGVPGPWYERLAHFKLEYTPSAGEELQSEYLVPRKHALDAIHEIRGLSDKISPHLHISEIRTMAADDLWLSPAYQTDAVGIHFTWKKDWPAVSQLLPIIEERLKPFRARPHWGKLSTTSGERLEELYPMMGEFRKLASDYDPEGKFRNAFLDRCVFRSI